MPEAATILLTCLIIPCALPSSDRKITTDAAIPSMSAISPFFGFKKVVARKFGEGGGDSVFLKNILNFKRVLFDRRKDRILAQGFFVAEGKGNPVDFFGRFIGFAKF